MNVQWTLGNYTHPFKDLFDSHMESVIRKSANQCNSTAFSDPEIAQYCVVLATKNSLKNSVGDYLVIVLSKLSTLISVRALNRCGLPVSLFLSELVYFAFRCE